MHSFQAHRISDGKYSRNHLERRGFVKVGLLMDLGQFKMGLRLAQTRAILKKETCKAFKIREIIRVKEWVGGKRATMAFTKSPN